MYFLLLAISESTHLCVSLCVHAFTSKLDVNVLTDSECMCVCCHRRSVLTWNQASVTDRRFARGVRDGSVLSLLARKPQTDTHEFTNTNPTGDGNLTAQEASGTLCTPRLNRYKRKVTDLPKKIILFYIRKIFVSVSIRCNVGSMVGNFLRHI